MEHLEEQPNSFVKNVQYPIIFFLRDPQRTSQLDATGAGIQGLKRIEIMLETSGHGAALPRMRKELGKLFEICGVPHSMDSTKNGAFRSQKRYVSI